MAAVLQAKNHMNTLRYIVIVPDSKVHGANMGPIWDRQGSGGPHVGPMHFAIWGNDADTDEKKTCADWMRYTMQCNKSFKFISDSLSMPNIPEVGICMSIITPKCHLIYQKKESSYRRLTL